MPQEQQVLMCFSCQTFQAHIVKKSKQWVCKICNAKQSFKRDYGCGSGKDCRLQVQKLNEMRHLSKSEEEDKLEEAQGTYLNSIVEKKQPADSKGASKWELYLDKKNEIEEEVDEDSLDYLLCEKKRVTNKQLGRNNKKRSRVDCAADQQTIQEVKSIKPLVNESLDLFNSGPNLSFEIDCLENTESKVKNKMPQIVDSKPVSYGKYGKYMEPKNCTESEESSNVV